MLTSDHDDTDSSISAQLNGAGDFLARGIQHTHTANKGQVGLRKDIVHEVTGDAALVHQVSFSQILTS